MPAKEPQVAKSSSGLRWSGVVMKDYVIEDELLRGVLDPNPKHKSNVITFERVGLRPWEALQHVHERKMDLVDFAKQFGLLGYTERLALQDKLQFQKEHGGHVGDPVAWFYQQAERVFNLVHLLADLSRDDANAVRTFLDKHSLRPEQIPDESQFQNLRLQTAKGMLWLPLPLTCERQGAQFMLTDSWPEDPLQAGRLYIQSTLNQQLEQIEVRRDLTEGADGRLQSSIRLRALIDVIYWKLADIAAKTVDMGNRLDMGRCLQCKNLFIRDDPRRKFCSDKCAGRHRFAKFWKENKAKILAERRKARLRKKQAQLKSVERLAVRAAKR